jgi:hypothetical protein
MPLLLPSMMFQAWEILRIGADVIFVVAEMLAIFVVFKRQHIYAVAQTQVAYLLPFLVLLPWIIGMRGHALVKEKLSFMDVPHAVLLNLSQQFLSGIIVAYAAVICAISSLMDLLHSVR